PLVAYPPLFGSRGRHARARQRGGLRRLRRGERGTPSGRGRLSRTAPGISSPRPATAGRGHGVSRQAPTGARTARRGGRGVSHIRGPEGTGTTGRSVGMVGGTSRPCPGAPRGLGKRRRWRSV